MVGDPTLLNTLSELANRGQQQRQFDAQLSAQAAARQQAQQQQALQSLFEQGMRKEGMDFQLAQQDKARQAAMDMYRVKAEDEDVARAQAAALAREKMGMASRLKEAELGVEETKIANKSKWEREKFAEAQGLSLKELDAKIKADAERERHNRTMEEYYKNKPPPNYVVRETPQEKDTYGAFKSEQERLAGRAKAVKAKRAEADKVAREMAAKGMTNKGIEAKNQLIQEAVKEALAIKEAVKQNYARFREQEGAETSRYQQQGAAVRNVLSEINSIFGLPEDDE